MTQIRFNVGRDWKLRLALLYPVLTVAPASTRSIVASTFPRTTAQWRAENPFVYGDTARGWKEVAAQVRRPVVDSLNI